MDVSWPMVGPVEDLAACELALSATGLGGVVLAGRRRWARLGWPEKRWPQPKPQLTRRGGWWPRVRRRRYRLVRWPIWSRPRLAAPTG